MINEPWQTGSTSKRRDIVECGGVKLNAFQLRLPCSAARPTANHFRAHRRSERSASGFAFGAALHPSQRRQPRRTTEEIVWISQKGRKATSSAHQVRQHDSLIALVKRAGATLSSPNPSRATLALGRTDLDRAHRRGELIQHTIHVLVRVRPAEGFREFDALIDHDAIGRLQHMRQLVGADEED